MFTFIFLLIFSFRSVQRGLYEFRQSFIPKNPSNVADFNADHDWLKIEKGESIVKGDWPMDDGERILFFSTNECLNILAKAQALCIDGTFKVGM